MAVTSAPEKSATPIIVPGQLALRTIHGRNGKFNVGKLECQLGKFTIKDAELEQYPEGKYQGSSSFATSSSKAIRSATAACVSRCAPTWTV